MSLLYRKDIDGLRALSIILVVGFHAIPGILPGGFVGVDIFFVISGFLISSIILKQQSDKTFSLSVFYSRRIKRIFPALFLVMAVTYALGWIILFPSDLSLLSENMIAGAAFLSNLLQIRSVDYFAPSAATNPLLHLWSLGIEEQFYIFWPLALMVLSRNRWKLYVAITVMAISFLLNISFLFNGLTQIAFYSPLTRAWELLAGAVAAFLLSQPKPGFSISKNMTAAIGLFMIFAAVTVVNQKSAFPGFWALLPVGGAVLLLVSHNSRVNKIFENKSLVALGIISYPLYLWHWPLLVYLQIIRNGDPSAIDIALTIVGAVLLSWITYRSLELPVRYQKNVTLKLSLAMVLIACIGVSTVYSQGFDFRFPQEVREIAALEPELNAGFRKECFLRDKPANLFDRAECIEKGNGPLIVFWGDSLAASLYPGFQSAQASHSFRIGQLTKAGCAPILNDPAEGCAASNAQSLKIISMSRPRTVMLHAFWGWGNDFSQLPETIKQLQAIGIEHIVVLGKPPVFKRKLPFLLVNSFRWQKNIPNRIKVGSNTEDDNAREFITKLGADYISAREAMCDSDGCITRVGTLASDVVTTDSIHLSDQGARYLLEIIGHHLF